MLSLRVADAERRRSKTFKTSHPPFRVYLYLIKEHGLAFAAKILSSFYIPRSFIFFLREAVTKPETQFSSGNLLHDTKPSASFS